MKNKHFTVRCSSPQEVVEVTRYIIESTDTECSEEQYHRLKVSLKKEAFNKKYKKRYVSTMYLKYSDDPNINVESPVLINYNPAPAKIKIKVYGFSQWKKLIAWKQNRVDTHASS